jgi:hypothetical protein
MRLSSRPFLGFCLVFLLASAVPASAQYQTYQPSSRATGENWHVEFGVGAWQPPPDIVVSSAVFAIIGSEINAQTDLGMEKGWMAGFEATLRPAKKHKFRIGYLPISYSAESVLTRTLIFNGQAFQVGLPINSTLDWKAFRFGYEYDFIYRDRGFLGVILEGKYSNVEVTLKNPLTTEWVKVAAPLPAVGLIGRGYVASNISITGEFTAFKLPTSSGILKGYDGSWYDFDFYGTLNFTDHFGARGGYRSITVAYRKDTDRGDMTLRGPYFMGMVRF